MCTLSITFTIDDELKKVLDKDDRLFGRESEAVQAWGEQATLHKGHWSERTT
jgi:hypothetical protein